MDFVLPPEIEEVRRRIRRFVDERLIPLESDRANYDEHDNIAPGVLADMRRAAKAEGLWALQMPRRLGGMELPRIGMAACYEEMNRSIFGPVVFNSAAPDDGNMMILDQVLPEAMKALARAHRRWRGAAAFAMTEPDGCGSDPGLTYTKAERVGNDRWRITGRKHFITGAGNAKIFIIIARTSDDERKTCPPSCSTPTRPAGRSSAASRSWGRRNMAGIASCPSTAWRSPTSSGC